MTWISEFVRYLSVLGDPRLEPGTIDGLPPFALRQTVDALQAAGWITTYEYGGADAWVDYARVDLRKGRSKLKLEWDQESGGSIDGPRVVLDELRVLDPWTRMQPRPH
ncbi:hypothetical protein ACFQ09_01340 [Massilia norwichensis]|uniref:Uncharacterized protein n=1 Tax=Massilia norwichensis TaxID=1442366 RepID=A0ABT2A0F5_9BURK|nr:hypothetical protein [Massilia norwichensis]MCS0587658.1 hypothetical protein [Massilia norwichensis]